MSLATYPPLPKSGAALKALRRLPPAAARRLGMPPEAVAAPTEDIPGAPVDLSVCGDPDKLSRNELLEQILIPAFQAGWLRQKHENLFVKRVQSLSLAQLREWAKQVLWEHPWAPGFHVPTFFEFVTSEEYLGQATPTPRQMRVFEEGVLGGSAWDWFVYRRKINLACLVFGKGSGKDWLSACILSYVTYCVGHMRNPWHHFRVPTGTRLDCINVAENGDQAKEVFFAYLSSMLQMPCFGEAPGRRRLLDQRLGVGDIKATRVLFWRPAPGRSAPVLAMRLLSLNSKSESVEGKNTFFWVMDEADSFRNKEGHANARAMFAKLTTSNRFGDQQIGIVISYPRAKNGFVLQLLKECGNRGGKRQNAWGDLAPTWEVLPFKVYQKCKVPMPDPLNPGRIIEEAYTNPTGYISDRPDASMQATWEHDPEEFRRVYACDPPAAEDAFVSEPSKIDEAVQAAQDALWGPVAQVEPYIQVDKAGGHEYRYVANRILSLSLRPGMTYYIGGDAGSKQDSFALAMFHAIPPSEQGFICPACWLDRERKQLKHYVPEPLVPVMCRKPAAFACDYCRAVPDDKHLFWGMAHKSGREITRPVIKGYSASGDPIFATEEVYDERLKRTVKRQAVEEVFLPLVVEDLLVEWQPDPREGLVVDFENVTQFLLELCATRQVGFVKIDQWQAEEKIQRLRRAGIAADTKQMSNPEQLKMYRNYKDCLYGNLLWLLPGEVGSAPYKARQQLRELQDINGMKVDHPKEGEGGVKGAKDLIDAEAMGIQLACEMTAKRGFVLHGRQEGEKEMVEHGRHLRQARQKKGSLVGATLSQLGVKGKR